MPIDLSHYKSLEQFTEDNIAEYNRNSQPFTAKKLKEEINRQLNITEDPEFTATEINFYLSAKFQEYLSDPDNVNAIDSELLSLSGTTEGIKEDIRVKATREVFYYKDLLDYYEKLILNNIYSTYQSEKRFRKAMMARLLEYNDYATKRNSEDQIKYIKNTLRKTFEKAMDLALLNGFNKSCININTGTKVANEGDSAQFLFLARAILAGFNCSNVDVRSSRYDAVIDYNGHLLRIQIKGMSETTVSFKDRDRGGAGVDPSARRNRGRTISSKDTDIYVAVDKQFGICYIIPAYDIDNWISANTFSKPVKDLQEYKENWGIVSEVADRLFP